MINLDDMIIEVKKELPRFYDQIKDFTELVKADAKVLVDLQNSVDEVLDQLFIETATWGLDRWEEFFGISPDPAKPIDQRRSVLKSKVRGAGVTTATLIKEVAESWYNGTIEVTELPGMIEIKFLSNYGVPENLEDVERALRNIIPAHLGIKFEFKYVLYRHLSGIAYRALTDLTYEELLTTEVDFDGTTHMMMQTATYGNLKTYTYGQIERGAIDG